ncbi:hypothetical protein IQ238_18715 [Pleurocapsales cyanobacterium LEGE 06147]|nr:hypothetical protein [Pleurocapsales cyanobacterium LEGE 06147]
MQKTAVILALTAFISISTYARLSFANDFQELTSGKEIPLTLAIDETRRDVVFLDGTFRRIDAEDWSKIEQESRF